jgi:sulfite reductase (NADPH) flavoprotein alpha-component
MPTLTPIIPETAPFTAPQRAWLNGFFAGVLGLGPSESASVNGAPVPGSRLLATEVATVASSASTASTADEGEMFPWHDPTLTLDERMQLAAGKPLAHRLMAAMAQLDCGACGYICQAYSAAIARGEEKDLTRCTPGGKETAKKLRALLAATTEPPTTTAEPSARASENGAVYNRNNPFLACVKSVTRLNHDGSAKDTRHVAIDLSGSGLAYEPGDSLGVYPFNCGELVDEVLALLRCSGDEAVTNANRQAATLRNVLVTECNLAKANERVVELLAQNAADPQEAERLTALATEDDGALLDAADVVDLLQICRSIRVPPQELLAALAPLQPRLYSISSSLQAHPNEVHLTVGVVRYRSNDRTHKGVCSTFLADRVQPGDPLRIFVQPSHGFRLPPDPTAPIIMVGPGTGIAPFRAFLEERQVRMQTGKNWLFFGDQRENCDFLYERELRSHLESGLLTRLDTAFSRDGAEKVYVQHRLLENSAELWQWLEAGAYFYVCGDAKKMAPDVDATLARIVREQGGRSDAEAKAYLQALRANQRYRRDVY